MFLTADEVRELTGYRQSAAQIRWLQQHRVHHFVSGKGKPIVVRHPYQPPPEKKQPEPYVVPPLDRDAVFRPLAEIRARRQPWVVGCGPDGPGVYFLFMRWGLSYVGQSTCVCARLRAHRMNHFDRTSRVIPFNNWSAIEVPQHWLNEVEYFYINKYWPRFNLKYAP